MGREPKRSPAVECFDFSAWYAIVTTTPLRPKEEIARCSRVMLEKAEREEEEKVIRELIVLQEPVSKANLNARHS